MERHEHRQPTPVLCLPQTWDTLENKPVVVGYSVGLLVGLYFVESLIHLPVLNLVRLPSREGSTGHSPQNLAFPPP